MGKFLSILALLLFFIQPRVLSEDGSQLWLRYQLLPDTLPNYYYKHFQSLIIDTGSPTRKVIFDECKKAFIGLVGININRNDQICNRSILIGTSDNKQVQQFISKVEIKQCGNEGYIIKTETTKNDEQVTILAANTDAGLLYGTFALIRLIQTGESVNKLYILNVPKYNARLLNHWDNLDGTVERGYAGHSIWWSQEENQEIVRKRWINYARANASIGINGAVLNNVNASSKVLNSEYIQRFAEIANILRPYHLKVYMAINFSSPILLDDLPTADPMNKEVSKWWKAKVDEIYRLIPDFGGFLVKANSEGQPGPQDFGRTHADGANLLADALAPHGGIVMWRAFVYSPSGDDRAKQANNEFIPLDGKFRKNVIIQVKNGPVDFQPREPFSPLFGSMKHTTLMPELQITQEYLGFSDHLVYLGTLYKEFLDADTYVQGRNSTVSSITDGSMFNDSITAIAGVSNIGEDINWCGHHFAQANWYVFGRLAWNHHLTAKDIAEEWLRQTFSHDQGLVNDLSKVMMQSREAVVNYMTPLGLHHLMGWGHHYGPEPWCVVPDARADWLPSYYHKADSFGIGFDRSSTGSNAVSQYVEPLRSVFDDPALCPDAFLLWFQHLPWDFTLRNGNDLWTELCYKYSSGVDAIKRFQEVWEQNRENVDSKRFDDIKKKLAIQTKEAIWWRDACLLYFQTYSKRPIPVELDQPIHLLDEMKKMRFDMTHHN